MATDATQPKLFSPRGKKAFQRQLLAWYARHERDLPWRKSKQPYRVWLSEVMLQQTQVATVKPYFERFVAAFPTVDDLAAADEQQVLRLWEGLGYYRRARQLHAAAKQVVAEHGSQFPRDVATLQTLPGVGRYTAGAIASIAYDQRAPILEANTIRLFSRLAAYRDDPTRAAGQRLLWHTAAEILPERDVARFNQALMELGSLVCRPTDPQCESCPVARWCEAHALGIERELPRSARREQYTDLTEAAVVVRKRRQVLMRRCQPGERWAGLWDFPRFEVKHKTRPALTKELATKVHTQTGISIVPGQLLQTLKHGVTRYRITLDCYTADYVAGRLPRSREPQLRWLSLEALKELPLSTTGRKIATLLAISAGKATYLLG